MDGPMWKLFEGNMASQKKIFDPMDQLNKDTLKQFMDIKEELVANGCSSFVCHPGYVDAELLGWTTLSLERAKDAEMMQSPLVKQWCEENNIELITYRDLV